MQKFTFIFVLLFSALSVSVNAQDRSEPSQDHEALLYSDDPVLAANKRLAYDMYREVLEAGQVARIPHYVREDYIQHNPNVVSGRAALEEFIAGSRPSREADEKIMLPLISIVAERDMVIFNFVRTEQDENGETYYTTWFDMFRLEGGQVVEHWDPALKSVDMLKFNPNSQRLK